VPLIAPNPGDATAANSRPKQILDLEI